MEGILKKKDDKENFWQHWDKFVSEHSAGPRYMRSSIENFIEMSTSRALMIEDESALLFQYNKPVGAIFLPIEQENGLKSISFSRRHIMAPIFSESFAEKTLMNYIDDIASLHQVDKIMLDIDPLLAETYPDNYLIAYDYLDNSLLTYLIDLSVEGDLFSNLRKGHRSDIKTVLKDPDFECFVVDQAHPNYDFHEEYREMHRIDAGRVTRSKESFDSQYKKLTDGNAALFGLRHKGKAITYGYYEMFKDKAMYASAAADPTMKHLPLYHMVMWSAMEYFQKNGIRFIDVGQPANPSAQYGYYPDAKVENIARFKRGFGGKFANEFRGIKYFNRELFVKEVDEFRDRYKATIISQKNVQK